MFGINELGLFIVAGLLLNITPGVDLLYVIQRSASQGLKSGIVAGLGISTGCLIHIFFASVGLSALLAASSTAFTVLKLIGAAYLIYLGLMMCWQSRKTSAAIKPNQLAGLFNVFKQGVLINLLNPKVALFFLAFIPQFIDTDSADKPLAFLILGLIFNFNGTMLLILVAWITSKAKSKLSDVTNHYGRMINRVLGVGFIALGARLATDR